MRSAGRDNCGKGGFTLVELAVVLAVTALLLTISAGAVFSYQSYAGYKHSSECARTIFLGAQAALSQVRVSGLAEELTARVERLDAEEAVGSGSGIPVLEESGCGRTYALAFTGEENPGSLFLYELLEPYVADETVFQGTFCVELDPESCRVQGVFYSSRAERLIYGESSPDGLGLGPKGGCRSDTEYKKRHELGYYGAMK